MRHRLLLVSLLALLVGARCDDPPITLYLAGDSTMAAKLPEKRPETGWGEELASCLASTTVRVENRAKNGRSTRTFLEEGLWGAITDSLRAGDVVFIQFGHNDESKDKVDRYTSPDVYRANLERFVDETRARGATPVLLTPVVRRRFDAAGNVLDTHGEYPGIVRAVAAERRVELIDMHRESARLLARYGPDSSRTLFLQLEPGMNANYPAGVHDNTHFSPRGARAMAALVVEALRGSTLPLARRLRSCPAAAEAEAR
jgi:lysophospholipase L1-like esterase